VRIITISSLKGGVGKTTLSAFLSLALASRGKVLAVDFDANNNLTDFFAREIDDETIENSNAYHFLTKKKTAEQCIIKGLFSDFMPGALSLHRLTAEMLHRPNALLSVKSLFPVGYDFIIIDTAPALDWSTFAGIYAADIVLSPVNFSRWTIQAARLLSDEISQIQQAPELKLVPSIVTEKEKENLLNFPGITKAAIHKSAAIRTASNKAQRLKDSQKSFLDFEELADEIIKGAGNGDK